MSLFGSLQLAGNALQATQIGLQVVGNNIANANTPGYVRERTIYTPAPVQDIGNLTIGLGVEVAGIIQSVDKFVEARLRSASSDRAGAEVQEKTYRDLQAILAELTNTDISSALTDFVNSLGDVKDDSDIGVRNLVVNSGITLAERVGSLNRSVLDLHKDFNTRVDGIAQEINALTEQISKLNLKIVTSEGGGTSASEAGGLRSQRNIAIKQLAELTDIRVNERSTGSVNISVGGDLLVFEGTRRDVKSSITITDGLPSARIQFADNDNPFKTTGGELNGIYESRDSVVGGFLDELDNFAGTLAFEFNKIYSQGQGIEGFTQITSTGRVTDPDVVLSEAGLNFDVESGSFNILVRNQTEGLNTTQTHRIDIDLNGTDGDSTLTSIAAAIDAIDGVSASISLENQLVLTSESADLEFSFGIDGRASEDESGFLAALGINTFFTGSGAGSLAVNDNLKQAGAKLAVSLDTSVAIGADNENALRLIGLYDESIDSLDGKSISGAYSQIINNTTQGATVTGAVADGLRVFEGTLDASAQAVSGVNLDEEAIDMIQLQRVYQASARYISTLSDLLDVLVNL